MVRNRNQDPVREQVRQALTRVAEQREPRIDRLLDSVPAMMHQARRRRQRADDGQDLFSVARWAVPRLALGTALLVLISVALMIARPMNETTGSGDLQALLLGNADEVTTSALLLDAIGSTKE